MTPRILLFIAGEPQRLDEQKYASLESSFHNLFKNTTFRHLGIGNTFYYMVTHPALLSRNLIG